MSDRLALHASLEDLKARVLAAGPEDREQIEELRARLEAAAKSAGLAPSAVELLRLGVPALRRAQESPDTSTREVLDAVAVALAAVAQDAAGEVEDAAVNLTEAAVLLRQLVGEAEGNSSAAAGAEVAPQPSSAPAAAEPSASDVDPELLKEFLAESSERIEAAEAALLALEGNPGDAEQVNTALRAFHTVKGAAGFLGLDRIQQLSHLAESLLTRVRDGKAKLSGTSVDLALQSCDMLKAMLRTLSGPAGVKGAEPEGLRNLLEQLSANGGAEAGAAAVSPLWENLGEGAAAPACAEPEVASREHAQAPADAQTVRVSTRRLDALVNMVGELVIAHSLVAQHPAVSGSANERLTKSVLHAGKIVRQLQDLAMGMRMVPLKGAFQKMSRLTRDLSQKSGKSVRLATSGEETEIDRNMVEELSDPLVHMIRNAVDHGIEPPEERARAGKPAQGVIHLRARHSGGNVVIEVEDDGRGLDRAKLLAKAAERGLLDLEREPTDAALWALIFLPGFSTAETVTAVSGRGVGMDIVKKNIEALRGRVDVSSVPGKGTRFTLRLPLTMAIVDAMLLRVGPERYLLPMIAMELAFRAEPNSIATVAGRGEMVKCRGELLPLFRLHRLFGVAGAVEDPAAALLVVIESHGERCALMIDELLGQHQVVVKSLGGTFAGIRGVSGGAILGDGRVGLILDAANLVQLSREPAPAR